MPSSEEREKLLPGLKYAEETIWQANLVSSPPAASIGIDTVRLEIERLEEERKEGS